MNYRAIWAVARQSFLAWHSHNAPRLGAALAFYTLVSLAPLVILVIAIAALVFGESAAQTHLLSQVESLIGKPGSEAVKAMIEHGQEPVSGTAASFIGIVTLLFGASGVFGELRAALNDIWGVAPEPGGGLWGTIRQRFFAFGLVLAVGFLLLVSLVISAALAALGKFFEGLLPLPAVFFIALSIPLSLAGAAVLFALIFRYVPAALVPWRSVWTGATVTAILFTAGKFLIGLYLGRTALGSAYGAAGSLVVVTVWVYYSAMIFLLGAEFTHVLSSDGRGRTRNHH